MRFFDLFSLIMDNLGRRKGRVALTAIGVVIGTAAVVILVSLAIGLQQNATSQLYGIGDLTVIQVYPGQGEMTDVKVMGGGGGGGGGGQVSSQKLLTPSSIKEFEAIPGVKAVIARDYLYSGATLSAGKMETWANIIGVDVNDLDVFGYSLLGGTTKLAKGTAVIGGWAAKSFYDPKLRPGQEPPPQPEVLDQQLRLTLFKYTADGMEVKKTYTLRIVGVLTEARAEQDSYLFLSMDDVVAMNQWVTGKRPNHNKDGFGNVIVIAESTDTVLDVTEQINTLGYMAYTPQSYVQGINSFFTVLQVVFGGVGAIALLVAAIGIANTMTMAILERTKEIGLMKAIGGTNRNVLSIFLGEAAGIGFIGGLGGVALGWLAGQALNVFATSYLAGQASQGGGAPISTAVVTPLWLPIFALVFATLVGLLSGLYPALRAATIVPVNALKYE
jgi:putative ABC transport system permease protein